MEQSTKRYLKTCGAILAVFLLLAAVAFSALSHSDEGAGPSSAQGVTVSDDGQQVKDSSLSYALDSFTRANKGTSKLYSGKYYGYRYPLVSRTSCAVAVTDTEVLVFIPQTVADELGIDLNDAATRSALESLIKAGDTASASGGQAIDRLDVPFTFIEGTTAERSGMVFETGFEVEEDVYYLTVYPAGMKLPAAAAPEDGSDPSRAALYAESFKLLPADQVTVSSAPTGWDAVADFFSTLDWRPLWVSLRSTALAMVVIFVLGLLAAWGTVRAAARWKGLLDTVFTIPMVLPPTVCGFLLLMFFGQSTDVGRWLIAHGIDLVFTWPAVVISCIVVAFPLMYRTARGAFEGLDAAMLDAARTLGWTEGRIFRKLMLPLTWPSIAAGTILAFARSMGEFGATLFFAGNYAGVTQTIPIAIYFDWMAGDTRSAIFWVIVVIALSFAVILLVNHYSARTRTWRAPLDRKTAQRQARREAPRGQGGTPARAAQDALGESEPSGKGGRA